MFSVVSAFVSDFLTGGNLRLVEAARLGLIVLVLLRLFFVFASSLPSTMAGFNDSLGVAVATPATAKLSVIAQISNARIAALAVAFLTKDISSS